MHRLTPGTDARLREAYEAGASLRALAVQEGLGHMAVKRAVLRAGGTMRREGAAGALTAEDVTSIRLSWATRSRTLGQLARRYGVGRSTIADVVYERTWREAWSPPHR